MTLGTGGPPQGRDTLERLKHVVSCGGRGGSHSAQWGMAVKLLHWLIDERAPNESAFHFFTRKGCATAGLAPLRAARLAWAVEQIPSEAAWNYLGWILIQELASYTQEERAHLFNEAGFSAVDILAWETATLPPRVESEP